MYIALSEVRKCPGSNRPVPFAVAGGSVITVVTPVSIICQGLPGLTTAQLATAGFSNEMQQCRDNSRNRRNRLNRWRRAGRILAWRDCLE